MIAMDTNVVVRLFVDDDAEQTARASALLQENEILISLSVLLETEWVLRSVYRFDSHQIISAFQRFFGLPQVVLTDPAVVSAAMRLFGHGMDFADALHLTSSGNAVSFATFDRKLIRASRSLQTPIDTFEP